MSGLSAPLAAEWSLIRVACSDLPRDQQAARIHELLDRPIRWDALVGLAEDQGVQPIVARALWNVRDVPAEALHTLKQNYQSNLHKALFLSRELARIVQRLSQADIEFLPYKGLTLAETLYGDIALRQSGDIDLLIHAADLKRVRDALAKLGYTPQLKLSQVEEDAYLKSGYECVFDGALGKNLLEVQWTVQPRFYAVDLDMEGLFRRGRTATVAGVEVKLLSAEDLFLLLALHAAKHAWGKLIWICDLARLSKLPALDWNWICGKARQLGIERIVRITLELAQRLLAFSIPSAIEPRLSQDRAAGPLAEEIEGYLANPNPYQVESLAYFRLMLRLRERRIDRMRFITRLVFTPGPGEWAIARLPKPLFPVYRALRISRLAARVAVGRIGAGPILHIEEIHRQAPQEGDVQSRLQGVEPGGGNADDPGQKAASYVRKHEHHGSNFR